MPGPQHGREGAAACNLIDRAFGEWTDAFLAREALRCLARGGFIAIDRLGNIVARYSGGTQIRVDTALPIATPSKRSRAHAGELTIIHKSQRRHFFDDRGGRRIAGARPAALAELAIEITGQLAPRRCIALDIAQREALQRIGLKR